MSTVEQIHHLEHRIDRLLTTLRGLRTANESLRGELADSEKRAAELERKLTASESARHDADRRGDELEQRLGVLHAEQEEIEAAITRTLDQLGKLDIGAASEAGDDGAASDETADQKPPADEAAVTVVDDAEYDLEAEPDEPGGDDEPDTETGLLPDDDHELAAGDEPETAAAAAADPETSADDGEDDDLDIF